MQKLKHTKKKKIPRVKKKSITFYLRKRNNKPTSGTNSGVLGPVAF
jgi:hypothetical protein